jgi:hypothetical protein
MLEYEEYELTDDDLLRSRTGEAELGDVSSRL